MIEVRPAAAADLEAFFGERKRQTVIALVAVQDGEVISIGGLARERWGYRAFWDVKAGHEDAIRTSHAARRAIYRVMRHAIETELPIVAVGDNPALLERLGFTNIEGDDYLWASSPPTPP